MKTCEAKEFIIKELGLDDCTPELKDYKGYRKAIKFVKEWSEYLSSISLTTDDEESEIFFTIKSYNVINGIKG